MIKWIKNRNSSLASILLLLVLAIFFVACGGDAGGGAEVGSSDISDGEAITLKFVICCGPDRAVTFDEIFKAWKAAEPKYANVTIELDVTPFSELFPKIESSVAAGADFDMFMADGPDIKHYSYNEVIISLDEYYTEEEKAEFLPATIEEGSYLGTFMTPATMQSCSLMFYNEDMTSAARCFPSTAA